MRSFFVLLGREVKSYFYSPIAYVVMVFFLIATGFNFYTGVSFLNQSPTEVTVVEAAFNTVLFWFPLILIFPLLTMRTYADEFRMGTFETMTTAPVQDLAVVLAKFFGVVIFYCVLWAPSLAYFAVFQWLSGKEAALSAGAYLGSYLLLLLIGMFYISIGCLVSSFFTEQINAAVGAFVFIFGAFVMGLLSMIMSITEKTPRDMVSYISAVEHMGDFSRGLLDSRPVVWYLSMTVFVLAVNFQVFQFRKWKA